MDFKQAIAPWSVALIARIVHCPERIAYAWKGGTRQPRPWVQRLILAKMKHVKPDNIAEPAE